MSCRRNGMLHQASHCTKNTQTTKQQLIALVNVRSTKVLTTTALAYSLEMGGLDRYEEEETGEGGEGGEVSGISISVCVNTSGAEEQTVPPQTTTLLTVTDSHRRLPHQRYEIDTSMKRSIPLVIPSLYNLVEQSLLSKMTQLKFWRKL